MADLRSDQGYHSDHENLIFVSGEADITGEFTYGHNPFQDRGIEMEMTFDYNLISSASLDLLPLFPEKFHSSEILVEYVRELGVQVGNWLTLVRDIVKLLSPNTVSSAENIRYLGALIGVSFPDEDSTTEAEMLRILTQAVDWYKVKGTYKSIDIIALSTKFTVNLWDMYTNDYTNFYLTDWFVGSENENPPGYDSSYYKSPHFGAEIVLDKTYLVGSIDYLWYSGLADSFIELVEETRPVHTVPHYMILLNPKTDEFRNLIEVSGEIKAKILGDWDVQTKYFDAVGSGDAWNFDDGSMQFDLSSNAFAKSITKYVLGSGNNPCTLGSSGFDVESPELTGTIDPNDITIDEDKISIEFIVSKDTVADGLSELGLYIPGSPDTLVAGACFPKLDKTNDVELRVLYEIWKTDLS